MELSTISRITIIAVGVENYKHMPQLKGAKRDVENLHKLLVSSENTALFKDKQFVAKIDPTSSDLREIISAYTHERSALGDILIFYFSGHGVAIGHDDFGFCTNDTNFLIDDKAVLPLTTFRFSELLEALSIVDVAPVIIIDACYSGKAADALVPPSTAINSMHDKIKASSASNYALLCSCSDLQTSINIHQKGGLFSQGIFEIAKSGIDNKDSLIGLKELFGPLKSFVETNADNSSPRLYLGETLMDLPVFKNVNFHHLPKLTSSEQSYSFASHLKSVIMALWNNGNPREFRTGEILFFCGPGAYGNHSKLSLEPWQLVENHPSSSKRRLTEKGLLFAQGKVKIPKTIKKDSSTGKWIAAPEAIEIYINDL
jgi:hypothetical protein